MKEVSKGGRAEVIRFGHLPSLHKTDTTRTQPSWLHRGPLVIPPLAGRFAV